MNVTVHEIKKKRRAILAKVRSGLATRHDDREYKRLGVAMLEAMRPARRK